MKIINLTPHDVHVIADDGSKTTFPKSEKPARVSEKSEKVGEINGVPLYKVTLGKVVDLPEPENDTYYIVSSMVRDAERLTSDGIDLLVPYGLMRNEKGVIVGCRGFSV